jgi:four helix bundle protein
MNNVLENKSYSFALRIIKLYKYLSENKKEYVLSKQVLRSGTSVGALIKEAHYAQSKADFISKLSIALKEAYETEYWLSLLKDSDYITKKEFHSIEPEIKELLKLLISSVNTSKNNIA